MKSPHAVATHGEVEALKQRLTHAEREVRVTLGLLKSMVCLSVAGVIGVGAFTASRSYATPHDGSSVRAPFQVIDSRGQVLLRIDGDENNRRIRMFASTGEAAVELGSTPDGGVLSVAGQGSGSALLLANADGGQLTVTGKKSTPIAWLGGRQNSGTLAFWDESGRQFACISPKKQIGALSVIREVRQAAPPTARTVHPARRPRKVPGVGKHRPGIPPKATAVHPAVRITALRTARHAPLRTVLAQSAPGKVAAVRPAVQPASHRKPVRGVIGTAVRGQKLGAPPSAPVTAKPATARTVKRSAHTYSTDRLKLPAGKRVRHHRRHRGRGHRGHHHWRSRGFAQRAWSHSGRRRLHRSWRWRGHRHRRRWRQG